jgi:hypothetical protein
VDFGAVRGNAGIGNTESDQFSKVVIPAKAGIHLLLRLFLNPEIKMGPSFRWDDEP